MCIVEGVGRRSGNADCKTVTVSEMFLEDCKMSTIPVDLPSDLQDFVETKVSEGRFASAGAYLVALVDAAQKNRSAIETALIEAIESGPADEWTSQEWQGIKDRVVHRHGQG